MGYEEALEGDAQRTAFRKAEKRYKLYKALRGSISSSKCCREKERAPSTDVTDVLDFRKILDSFNQHGTMPTPPGITIHISKQNAWPIFTIEQRPGFYFIPEALSMEEQFGWIKQSLVIFTQPPNRTNHTQFHGAIDDLWSAAVMKKLLVEDESSESNWVFMDEDELKIKKSRSGASLKSIAASTLLRKLRWATLGLQFDWSKRNYDASLPHMNIPDALSQLAKELARPAMQKGEFHAEAAIVNYFASDDMLGGHLDDMEADWSKPIVSISLGCKAIFLLGGESRHDPPIAMFLRSGDVVLMAGPARQCFHGIPRIFTDQANSEVPLFQSNFFDPSDAPFIDYIKDSRININIRQVY